jgi:GDP-mannose 6-dehydrogenase
VFGLGYVGAVSAACLASEGHSVIGVDPNQVKVDMVREGRSPVIESHIADLIADGARAGRLRATGSCLEAIAGSDLAFLCVGTPSQANGSLDLTYLRRVCGEIGAVLRERKTYFTVVVRSTVTPGTTRSVVVPLLEAASGKRDGEDFGVCMNPEFLREGSAVQDFFSPPKVVIGATDDRARRELEPIAAREGAPLFHTALEVAEMTKYADNTWHALKVAFANEIGALSKAHGIDGRQVMEVFCADEKLNISTTYLKPGFAFGGSCLPKDVRALRYRGRSLDLDLPVVNAILPSNERHIDRAFQMIAARGSRKVGILGLSFKAGTDDLRESPMVDVVERLIGKGYDLRIYDGNVSLARLMGANRDYILNQIPHISELMVASVEEVLDHAQTVVIGNADPAFRWVVDDLREGQSVVDFVRVSHRRSDGRAYDGIAW